MGQNFKVGLECGQLHHVEAKYMHEVLNFNKYTHSVLNFKL